MTTIEPTAAQAPATSDREILEVLAFKLTTRGTKLSHGIYHQRAKGRPWYIREANRRDWRDVAMRYLRRFAGGAWYAGGHHVARGNHGIAIGEQIPRNGTHSSLKVDGRRVAIEIIR